ncbi:histidine kinase-like protein [Pseudomonas duriflava]|uniref:Histidine kinase-like protein n=1 Tax=Pseudomonas duriflava TaxID=459528 RepID=A0A562QB33_9PSED|nr:ATP-binding protein [Pseudomonas duriflava]TWI53919.1 histidine kinase-like protein [Pseudomonas duriflava]
MTALLLPGNTGLKSWRLDAKCLARGFSINELLGDWLPPELGQSLLHIKTQLVLNELLNNAIDHGLLRLDSNLKCDAAGFSYFLAQRKQRLAKLRHGFVTLDLTWSHQEGRAVIQVEVGDSGPGFDLKAVLQGSLTFPSYAGRGLPLVRYLCKDNLWQSATGKVCAIFVATDIST